MADEAKSCSFSIVVSDSKQVKLGIGGTAKASDSLVFYYAVKSESETVSIQALNQNFIPAGDKHTIEMEEFLKRYKPEPMIYFNKVVPALDALEKKVNKAETQLKNERLDRAEATFKEVLAVDPGHIRAVFGLGVTYLAGGNIESASEIFERIMTLELDLTADCMYMFNEFGIKMRKTGMLENALAYYQKALGKNTMDENLYFNLARVYYEMKDVERAVEALDKALSIAPDFTEAQMMRKFITK